MRPLSDLLTRRGDLAYQFDGILRFGEVEYKVYGVPFETLSVDGYGTDAFTVSDRIWVQSRQAERHEAWYILKNPSQEYARYHVPFLWLADFTKHFVGYVDHRDDMSRVKLHDFRSDFHAWLAAKYQNNWRFKAWHKMFNHQKDFRSVITANYEYLRKESVAVQEQIRECYIWKEVDAKALSAVPLQPLKAANTVVTPYVYDCFKDMYFARAMEPQQPADDVALASLTRAKAFEALANMSEIIPDSDSLAHVPPVDTGGRIHITTGDVVQIEKDVETPWKSVADSWYAYVQSCEKGKDGSKVLRVIWLYLPEDTTCARMKYPFRRELFFSDHCNCGSVNLAANDVLRKVKVRFSKEQNGDDCDFFVRQTYVTDPNSPSYASFITFREAHLRCDCRDQHASNLGYVPGQTILVSGLTRGRLEPAVLVDTTTSGKLKIRRFERRRASCKEAKPNELVYTDVYDYVAYEQVKRACHIRCYGPEEIAQRHVPALYNYNGTGDCWILTGRLRKGIIEPLSACPEDMIEGFDPKRVPPERLQLKGLSLFCGGGSFDRGFEESGAVRFTHAVDWAQQAIHTCRANAEDPDQLNLFYGNVNDYLHRAMKGDSSAVIAKVGKIGFMTAGSPCVAFSLLQPDAMSESSLRNASLVAALTAAVDLYRPEYGVFENVFAIAHNRGPRKDENVLSQMIAAFVGMAYQVQIFNQDAHCTGSGEQRSRLLLVIAAPGLRPLQKPPNTHSHPVARDRTIGKASNGMSFGKRIFEETPFDYLTAADTIGDLPDIGDAQVNMCIPVPDHRISAFGTGHRLIISHIPRFPFGCNWSTAVKMGFMPQGVINASNRKSKLWLADTNRAFGRVYPNRQIPTVITTVTPDCAMNGRALHYDQPRVLTVMEARRAQSYPDHEVLVGDVMAQWKIIGNSVDRTMAAATGVSLRFAWLANDPDYPRFVDDYVLDGEDRVFLPDAPRAASNTIEEDVSGEEDVVRLPGRADLGRKLSVESVNLESDSDMITVRLPTDAKKRKPLSVVLAEYREARKVRHSLPARLTARVKSRTSESTDELAHSSTDIIVSPTKPLTDVSSKASPEQALSTPQQAHVDVGDDLQANILVPATQRPATPISQAAGAPQSIPSTLPTDQPMHKVRLSKSPQVQPRSEPAVEPRFFSQFAARQRSPTTGRILPRQTTSAQSPPTRPAANSARRLTAVQTSGLLSPAPSEDVATPISVIQETISATKQSQPLAAPFSTLRQRSPSRHESDEDELSTHVDQAIAVTDTSLLGLEGDVTIGDVLDEAQEHLAAGGGGGEDVRNVPRIPSSAIAGAEDTDSDWMDYELTG
jgi:DNA (cytosine-5)-methyltransferase 1